MMRGRKAFVTVVALAMLAWPLLAAPPSEPSAAPFQSGGITTRVSVASDGRQGNYGSAGASVSADGRYVAFHSYATNLVPGDTNGWPDVFVHDRQTGQTTRVSVASDGTQGNEYSGSLSISADGRYVAFYSDASNLVPDDTNGKGDVFVHDRQPIPMPFSDVSPGDWFYEAVMNLYNRGIITGYPDGIFGPSNQVTRAEFATMLVRAMGWAPRTSGGPHFSDVSPGGWYYDFVETAYNRGMVSGYPDGTFRPDNPISRAEIATMIVRAMGWAIDTSGPDFPDVPSTHWAYGFIKTARNHGVVSGYPDGTFKPDNPSTRAEAAAMIYRALP